MHFFETRESSFSLMFGALGIVLFELYVFLDLFGEHFPPIGVQSIGTYVAAFLLWGVPSFLVVSDGSRRKLGLAYLAFLIVLGLTYGLRNVSPLFETIAQAFPGFPAGSGYAVVIILVQRYISGNAASGHKGYRTMREDLADPVTKSAYTFGMLVYVDLTMFIMYFTFQKVTVLLWGAMSMLVVCIMASFWAGSVNRHAAKSKRKARYNSN